MGDEGLDSTRTPVSEKEKETTGWVYEIQWEIEYP